MVTFTHCESAASKELTVNGLLADKLRGIKEQISGGKDKKEQDSSPVLPASVTHHSMLGVSGNGFQKKRYSGPNQSQASSGPSLSSLDLRRIENIRKLVKAAKEGPSQFAEIVYASYERLNKILEAQAQVSDEFSYNVEVQLDLAAGWLDQKHEEEEIPPESLEILAGLRKPSIEAEIEEASAKLPVATYVAKTSLNLENLGKKGSNSASEMQSQLKADNLRSIEPMVKPLNLKTAESKGDKMSQVIVEPDYDVRRHNLRLITQAMGSKSKFAEIADVKEATVSHFLAGRMKLKDSHLEDFAKALRVKLSWFDELHTVSQIPESIWDFLGHPKKLEDIEFVPTPESEKKKMGRPPKQRTPEELAAAAVPKKRGRPSSKVVETVAAVAPATVEVEALAPVVKPAPVVTKAAPKAKSAAPAPVEAPAPVAPAPEVAPVAATPVAVAPAPVAAPVVTTPTGLPPLVAGLLNIIQSRAQAGTFGDEDALKLLMQLNG